MKAVQAGALVGRATPWGAMDSDHHRPCLEKDADA